MSKKNIYTIGHSNIQISEFVELLNTVKIKVVVDVRSRPFSKYAPQYNKNQIHSFLSEHNIMYLYMGNLIGGMPQDKKFYDHNGFVKYDCLANSASFKTGISRLIKGVDLYRTALMCSEENPTNCHRRLLIGKVLKRHGIKALHIRKDGIVQTENDFNKTKIPFQTDLFGKHLNPKWRSVKPVLKK